MVYLFLQNKVKTSLHFLIFIIFFSHWFTCAHCFQVQVGHIFSPKCISQSTPSLLWYVDLPTMICHHDSSEIIIAWMLYVFVYKFLWISIDDFSTYFIFSTFIQLNWNLMLITRGNHKKQTWLIFLKVQSSIKWNFGNF